MKNPYEILGLNKEGFNDSGNSYNLDDIKAAYRKRAPQVHPDRNPDDSEADAKFKQLSVAYESLCNPEKRADIDKLLKENPEYFEEEKHLFLLEDEPDNDKHKSVDSTTSTLTIYCPKGINLTALIVNADYSSEALIKEAKQKPKFAEAIFDSPSILIRLSIAQQVELFLFYYDLHKTKSLPLFAFIPKIEQKIKENESYQNELTTFCIQPQHFKIANCYVENSTAWLCSILKANNLYLLATTFACIVLQGSLIKFTPNSNIRPFEVKVIVDSYPHLKAKILQKLSSSISIENYSQITDYLDACEAIKKGKTASDYFGGNPEKLLRLKFEAQTLFGGTGIDVLGFTVLLVRCLYVKFGDSWEKNLTVNEIDQLTDNFFRCIGCITTIYGFIQSLKSEKSTKFIEDYFESKVILTLLNHCNETHFLNLLKEINVQLFKTCQAEIINFILSALQENEMPLFLRLLLKQEKNALICVTENPILLEKLSITAPYRDQPNVITLIKKQQSFWNLKKVKEIKIQSTLETTKSINSPIEKIEPIANIIEETPFEPLGKIQNQSNEFVSKSEAQFPIQSIDSEKLPINAINSGKLHKSKEQKNKKPDKSEKDHVTMDEETFLKNYIASEFSFDLLSKIETESTKIVSLLIKDALDADWENSTYKINFFRKLHFLFKKQCLDKELEKKVNEKLLDIHFRNAFNSLQDSTWFVEEKWFFCYLFAGEKSSLTPYLNGKSLSELLRESLKSSYHMSVHEYYEYSDPNYKILENLYEKVSFYKSYSELLINLNSSNIELIPKLLKIYPTCNLLIFLQVITTPWFKDKCNAYQELVEQLKKETEFTDEKLNTIVDLIQKSGPCEETLKLIVTQLKETQPIFLNAILFLLEERASKLAEKAFIPIIQQYKDKSQSDILFNFFSVAQCYIKKHHSKISGDTLTRFVTQYGEKIIPTFEESGLDVKYTNQKQLENALNKINPSSDFHTQTITDEQQISEFFDCFETSLNAPLKNLFDSSVSEKLYAKLEPLWKRTQHFGLTLFQKTYPKKSNRSLLLWSLMLVIHGHEPFKAKILEILQNVSNDTNKMYFDSVCQGISSLLLTADLQIENLNILGAELSNKIVAWFENYKNQDTTLNPILFNKPSIELEEKNKDTAPTLILPENLSIALSTELRVSFNTLKILIENQQENKNLLVITATQNLIDNTLGQFSNNIQKIDIQKMEQAFEIYRKEVVNLSLGQKLFIAAMTFLGVLIGFVSGALICSIGLNPITALAGGFTGAIIGAGAGSAIGGSVTFGLSRFGVFQHDSIKAKTKEFAENLEKVVKPLSYHPNPI